MMFELACIAVFTATFIVCILSGLAFYAKVLTPEEAPIVGVMAAATNAGIHATVCTCWAFWLLTTSPGWTDFDAANTRAQTMALCLSLGYFVADTVAYLIPFTPTEYVYLVHHAFTVAFLAASLHLGRGAHACLFGLWIGEITNPPFHAYNILNGLRARRPWAHRAFLRLAPAFTAFFIATRSVAGPFAAVWWCAKVAGMHAPLTHRACWVFVCAAITAVSQPFALGFARDTGALLAAEAVEVEKRRAAAGRRPGQRAGGERREPSIYDSAQDMFALVRRGKRG